MTTLLDTQETSALTADFGSYRDYTTRRGTDEDRLTRVLYDTVDDDLNTIYVELYDKCRTDAWFVREIETGYVRIVSHHCRLRWCSFCARVKAFKASLLLEGWVRKALHPKLLTLTLKSADLPLATQIDRIYDAFRSLRKREVFKSRLLGGVWFFQVTKSSKTGYWHPHIHCLCEGRYIPHRDLKSMWEEITGDSVIVDIRPVRNVRTLTNDVTRYISRPMSLKGLSPDSMLNLFHAFHGRRLCGTFGTARKISQQIKLENPAPKIEKVGSWSTVMFSRKSDPAAQQILDCYLRSEPLPAGIDVLEVDDFILDDIALHPIPSVLDLQPYFWTD
ncbi:hypothetical protein ES703_87496 [subsurface metagenome]